MVKYLQSIDTSVIHDFDFFSDYIDFEENIPQNSFQNNVELNDRHIILIEKIIKNNKLNI